MGVALGGGHGLAASLSARRVSGNVSIRSATRCSEASARAGKGKTVTFFKDSQGRIVVPLKITGPVESPSMDLDDSKVLQRGSGQLGEKGFGTFFKQLFRKPVTTESAR